MNIEELLDFCLQLPGEVTEDHPYGNDVLVFRIRNKIFLLTPLDEEHVQFNVKCVPEKVQELREKYPFVKPGYHMNKSTWNTIVVQSPGTIQLYKAWIRDSYDLIVASLPAKVRKELSSM
jgi:predicted DNA-binding protein (MmcQ/YjbR family)